VPIFLLEGILSIVLYEFSYEKYVPGPGAFLLTLLGDFPTK